MLDLFNWINSYTLISQLMCTTNRFECQQFNNHMYIRKFSQIGVGPTPSIRYTSIWDSAVYSFLHSYFRFLGRVWMQILRMEATIFLFFSVERIAHAGNTKQILNGRCRPCGARGQDASLINVLYPCILILVYFCIPNSWRA